ncbi:MAG: MarR family transcriptional regulator [Bacteroidales bacterium]|nr:MarR family transcriptional regulator [Candidatus Equibacterium intestinale]
MILSKSVAVSLNLAACKLKQFTAAMIKKNNIDLTPEQFLLIDLLWNEGPMSQQVMADTMHKDKNSITNLADQLERKGWVVRKKDDFDRRSNILTLTEKAESLKLEAKEKGISILEQIIEGISEEDLTVFLNTLEKLSDNMNVTQD